MQEREAKELSEYSLFFEQENTWQARKQYEDFLHVKYPKPLLQLTIKAKNLPDALKAGWDTVTHSETALLSYVGFIGVYLPVEKKDLRAQMLNSYYNAALGRVVSEKRLKRARIQYPDLYSGDKLKEAKMKELEAMNKSAGKAEAIKDMFESAFGGEIMTPSDIFLLEYLNDVVYVLESASDRAVLEELLSAGEMDALRTFLNEGVLPNGNTINEYIPVSGWELSECFFLTDYNGYPFLGEYEDEVNKSINLAVGGNVSPLRELLKTASDMRPFAIEINKLHDAKLYEEIDFIVSGLTKCKVKLGDYFTKEQWQKWQSLKERETNGSQSLLGRLEEKSNEVKARSSTNKASKRDYERG